jgi:hypothetical protein
MKKCLSFITTILLLLFVSACSLNNLQMNDGVDSMETKDNLPNVCSPEIAFAFYNQIPLSLEQMQILDETLIESIIYSGQTVAPDINQGFYRKNNDDEPQNIYSYIEINEKKFNIGQIGYGEDSILKSGSGNFWFLESNFDLDKSDVIIYQQYKIYGAAYDAVAYYIIENEVLLLLCEISGVISYSDYDMSGITAILSIERTMPYTEYIVSKFDLQDKLLHYTCLTDLLDCDGVFYDKEREGRGELFFTYHIPADLSHTNPTDGCVYSFDKGVFKLRYTPANNHQSQ